jgi:glycosyltransferase involved in cell wall biosynthesis
MRILQVHSRYREAGGEDAVMRAEGELLSRAGHEVIPYVGENPTRPLPTAAALAMASWNALAARAMQGVIQQVQPDIAHVHNTWFSLSPSVIAVLDRAGVPVVVTLHNFRLVCINALLFRDGHPCEDCVGTHPWRGVRHRCYRGSAVASTAVATATAANRALGTWHRHVRLFLALNEFARDRFIRGGLPAHKVLVKPNFVSDPGSRDAPPSSSPVVLYVGRLASEKGVMVLLDAWRARGPTNLELVIIGDGHPRAQLERQAPPGVSFKGWLPSQEVRRWMLRSRALVLPSVGYEGQPMAVLEALAAGLPVLGSRAGGNVELLEPQGAEWLITPGVPAAWARALSALGDGALVDEVGARARRLYEERFTEQIGRRLLEEAYRTASGSRWPSS